MMMMMMMTARTGEKWQLFPCPASGVHVLLFLVSIADVFIDLRLLPLP
jgi:hypothetical protein